MKKRITTHKTRKFAVLLRSEPEGGFTVRVPELPEIVTYGKDERDALVMAQEAIELVLEDSNVNREIVSGETPRIREVAVAIET